MIQTTSSSSFMGILSTGGTSVVYSYYFQIIFCVSCKLDLQWTVTWEKYETTNCQGLVMNDNIWHTVLVTYDGTTILLYVDGLSQSSTTTALNTIGNSYNYLGKAYTDSNFIGTLKNVMFFDYVITTSYALANSYQSAGVVLYNSGKYFFMNEQIIFLKNIISPPPSIIVSLFYQ